MMKRSLLLSLALASFFYASAQAQNAGTVTNHAIAIGKGAGVQGYSSLPLGNAQIPIGQTGADPQAKTVSGDATLDATGALTLATVNSNVGSFGSATQCVAFTTNGKGLITAASAMTCTPAVGSITGMGTGVATWLATPSSANLRAALTDETGTGAAYFQGGDLGTPSAGVLTNATGLPIGSGVSGLGTGCATFLGTPSSANLRGCLTDEVGTGAAYFVGGALGTPASGTATNLTGLPANGGLTGQVPIANGGTSQSTAAAARASSGLNVDSFTGHGDSIYSILATDRTVGTNAVFTASRTWTLPAANAVNPGQEIVVADFQGTVTGTNTLIIARSGADTINGVTSITIASAYGAYLFKSDGSSKWNAQALGSAAAGGVTSVTCGTGLSGGTITTSGTCAVNLSFLTNSIASDIAISTSSFTDGPSVAQGTSGTWYASGTVTITSTVGSAIPFCKLWDGTTAMGSTAFNGNSVGTGGRITISLSGVISSPAGNIRISCQDVNGATSGFRSSSTGVGKDSTITAFRIQ